MSFQRRRAGNFTDSLYSFRNITCSDSETDNNIPRSYSKDSLEQSTYSSTISSSTATRSSKHSTILAGSSLKDSLEDVLLTSTRESCLFIEPKPDLNKCIHLFNNDNVSRRNRHKNSPSSSYSEFIDNKENSDPQCSMSDIATEFSMNVLEEQVYAHKKLSFHDTSNEDSTRDSNYNIPHEPRDLDSHRKEPLFSEEAVLQNKDNDTGEYVYEADEDNPENKDTESFQTILHSLDNQLNQCKEISGQTQILKRLSERYMYSPRNFTEKLLTIIEESVATNAKELGSTSAVDLSRLTTEFRKMCKFIEDESCPEWPVSPLSPCKEYTTANPDSIESPSNRILKNEMATPNTKFNSATPISSIDRIKDLRRFCCKVPKNTLTGSVNNTICFSPVEGSNMSFEFLEAQCKRLVSDKEEASGGVQKSLSMPSLLSMSEYKLICEKQMASLNSSDDTIKRNNEVLTPCAQNSSDKTPNYLKNNSEKFREQFINQFTPIKVQELNYEPAKLQYDNASYPDNKSRRNNLELDSHPIKTLRDLAQRRRSCLDTAELITVESTVSETLETKSSSAFPNTSNGSDSNSRIRDASDSFLNTLESCKNYHSYLTKKKSFFDVLQNSQSSLPTVPDTSTMKKVRSPRVEPRRLYKTPSPRPQLKKTDEKWKPKYFVTPTKSPKVEESRKKQPYFPTVESGKKSVGDNILKSPHAEGLYRLNYNTIISPVGMYIRGTDMQLIKNVRPKKDHLLLTPLKNNDKKSPAEKTKRAAPKNLETQPLKLKLSPKLCSTPKLSTNCNCGDKMSPKTPINTNTVGKDFVLPKVSYKLPLQVQTIKETTSPRMGNRMKGLLESAQSKVVIRHKGRTNSVKKKGTNNTEQYEINYDPADDSIHVEQAAYRTNFIHRQKFN